MNREQRRAAERQRFDEYRARGDKRAQGVRVIRGYGLDGAPVFTQHVDADREMPAQIRVVMVPPEYRDQVHTVEDAERLGRIEWIRCFLLDPRHPPCYREVRGGHDRLPHVTESTSYTRNLTDYPGLAVEAENVSNVFPDGEIFPAEAIMLAFLIRDLRVEEVDGQIRLPDGEAERSRRVFWEMLDKTGLHESLGTERAREHIARLPALRRRWMELRKRAESKP